ncbi:exonuclease [Penicillium angulare]|uniref:exonuclease n=1 Tax=Penicillium angulare TaxID=116970 RepID=UPI002541461E|nr:exonuclease [Penicillium angulare]KAJ5267099.1 exonuclease [Penicillium angulare]
MFTTLGLFDNTPCPEGKQCPLITCMFSHKIQASNSITTEKRASSSINNDEHVSKRLKVDRSSTPSISTSNTPHIPPNHQRPAKSSVPAAESNQKAHAVSQDVSSLPSISRRVSPPPSGRTGSQSTSKAGPSKSTNSSSGSMPSQFPPRKAPKESLNPRMLQKAPATHTARSAILNKLHGAMSSLNEKVSKDKDTSNKCFVLNKDELVTMALDEEEKLAKNSFGVYSNVIKLRIVKLTKMAKEDWTKEVMEHLNTRYYHIQPIQPQSLKSTKPITTGLSTKEEITLVEALVTPLIGLEEFGYVTKAPSSSDVETAKKGVIESKGWEKCDRCGGRFQVFPGRREDGTLTSGGHCTYHPSRPIYPPRKKTDGVTGSSEAYFSCCSESVGTSTGCTKAKTHVFKVSEAKRLASILQFETTPTQPDTGGLNPVSFDCEMGYTTLGLELIRLTAVSWPEGNELLDVLVKPMGEVLDLNSRYSGVFPEHYASAIPYGTSANHASHSDQKKNGKDHKPLQVVESPAAARALLFGFIQPQTPLIGHAIDNDLNACRVIHPTIIDTVLLYPHPGRLPNRMGLKVLSRKFLERDIQMGGDQGHDSKEDSITTGDLVRVKASDLWKRLRAKGWKFEDNHIIAPPGQASQDIRKAAHEIGFATGYKRKATSTT